MNAEVLIRTMKTAAQSGDSILVVSEPGQGKSDIVKQVAKELSFDLAVFHPSVEQPTDVKGFPWCTTDFDGKVHAEFVVYGEMEVLLNPKRRTIAFFDDLGQADEEMQAALMQILWARELNGKPISQNVVFAGATNDTNHKAAVRGFIEPLKSRWSSIVRYSPTVDDWILWGYKNGMPDVLMGFIKYKPDQLNQFKPSKELKNSPCPRTVASWGRMLNRNYPKEARFELCAGSVGEGFAAEYFGYEQLHGKLPKFEDILADPTGISVEFENLAILYALTVAIARRIDRGNFKKVIKFISRIPEEFQMRVMKDVRLAQPAISRTPEYTTWLEANKDLLSV